MEKQHKTMRLKSDLVKKIQKMAEKENRSFNNMIETLLEKAVA